MDVQRIGFGGGCHWCTEAVFSALRGLSRVSQGFIASDPPNDSYSEAVEIAFDPVAIPLKVLVDIHLRTHASTSNHKMRGKYRSAVYVFSHAQADEVKAVLDSLAPDFAAPLVTQVLAHRGFKASDPQFRNYRARSMRAGSRHLDGLLSEAPAIHFHLIARNRRRQITRVIKRGAAHFFGADPAFKRCNIRIVLPHDFFHWTAFCRCALG
jgi:peptide-methionine (S)-S-oxide reductase